MFDVQFKSQTKTSNIQHRTSNEVLRVPNIDNSCHPSPNAVPSAPSRMRRKTGLGGRRVAHGKVALSSASGGLSCLLGSGADRGHGAGFGAVRAPRPTPPKSLQ